MRVKRCHKNKYKREQTLNKPKPTEKKASFFCKPSANKTKKKAKTVKKKAIKEKIKSKKSEKKNSKKIQNTKRKKTRV